MPATDLDQIVNLAKRRGFVYPSAEIYGGFRSSYDYGPLGSLMLKHVKDAWIRSRVQLRDDVVLIDAAMLGPPASWEASGHLATFADPLVDCKVCRSRFREDDLEDPDVCPSCGAKASFTEARAFNLMFKTFAGPVEGAGAEVYLRPETAQGMFVNFANVLQTTRKKPPFGIAQVGKSFRNEITPGNFIFRTREFEQMEMEYFVPPEDGPKWFEYWCAERFAWYVDHGIPADMLRLRAHEEDELSHYSAGTSDVEFRFPWGWGELEGIAQRTDYDLTAHAKHSGEKLEYFDQATGQRYVPYVIEPAAGANRTMAAFLLAAYDEDEVGGEARTVLRLHPRLAPYQVAVLPLSRKETLLPTAREVHRLLSERWMVDFDDTQSIGRRYRRQDEVRTPTGRGRHAVRRAGRLRDPRRPGHHHPRTGHDRAGPRPPRPPRPGALGPPRTLTRAQPQQGRRVNGLRANQRGKARTSGRGPSIVSRPDRMASSHVLRPAHTRWSSARSAVTRRSGVKPSSRSHTVDPDGSRTSQIMRPRSAVGNSNWMTVRCSGSSSSTSALLTRHMSCAPSIWSRVGSPSSQRLAQSPSANTTGSSSWPASVRW